MPGFGCLRAEGENRPSRPNHVIVEDGVKCLNPWDTQSIRQFDVNGAYMSLQANSGGGQNRSGVCYALDSMSSNSMKSSNPLCYRQDGFAGYSEGVGTLKASGGDMGGVRKASSLNVFDARGNGNGETVPTITGDHQNRVSDYTCICIERNHDE